MTQDSNLLTKSITEKICLFAQKKIIHAAVVPASMEQLVKQVELEAIFALAQLATRERTVKHVCLFVFTTSHGHGRAEMANIL